MLSKAWDDLPPFGGSWIVRPYQAHCLKMTCGFRQSLRRRSHTLRISSCSSLQVLVLVAQNLKRLSLTPRVVPAVDHRWLILLGEAQHGQPS